MHRCLMSTQHLPDPSPNLIEIRLTCAFFMKEKGGRNLDVARMRYTNDNSACYGFMLDETFFDFEWIDVLAAYAC
jgi:hypothetical protein